MYKPFREMRRRNVGVEMRGKNVLKVRAMDPDDSNYIQQRQLELANLTPQRRDERTGDKHLVIPYAFRLIGFAHVE